MTSNNLLSTQGDRALFLETLVNQSKDGILVIDRKGIILFANPAAEEMFADQEEDLLGYQIGMPAVLDDVELRLPRGDQMRTVEMRASQMTWEGQDVYLVSLRDVTDRVEVEQELRKREELLVETGRMARVGGWEINFETNSVWWSEVTREIHQVPAEYDPTLDKAVDFFPASVRPKLKEAIQRARMDGIPYDTELPFVTAKGKELWVRAIGKAERQPGGKVRVYGTFQDITDQKEAQNQLQKSEKKFRTLYETMNQGVVYQNAEGEILSANPAAERILGLSLDQMQGKTSMDPDWKAITPDGDPLPGDQHPSMVALRSGEKVENFVLGVYHPQREEYVWISVSAIPQFRENSQEPFQVFTTFLDISDRINTERALKERVKELRCLAAVGKVLQHESSLEAVGAQVIELIVSGMQYPDITAPVVEIGGHRSESDHYHQDLSHKLRAEIRGKDKSYGHVSVYYTKDHPFLLPEEQALLDQIAEMLALWYEQMRTQERFQALIENAQDMITVLDSEGKVKFNSPALEGILGYSPEEHQGKLVFDYLHPDDIQKVLSYFRQRADEPGALGRIEYRMRHKNGEWRVIESVGRNALDVPAVEGIIVNSRDITRRYEYEQVIQQQVEQLSMQYKIASLGVAVNDEDLVIQKTTQMIKDAFSPHNCGVFLLHPRAGQLRAHPSYIVNGKKRPLTSKLGQGIIGKVADTGQALNIPDVQDSEDYVEFASDVQSELCVPMKSGPEIVGVVNIESTETGDFDEGDKDLLEAIANQLATVLNKIRSVKEAKRRMKRLQALREIDQAITGSLDLNTTLKILIDRMIRNLEVDAGAILLYQPHLQMLEFVVGSGFRTDAISKARPRLGEGHAGRVILKREMVQIPDLTLETVRFERATLARKEEFVAYYGVPLIAKGETIGVLEVFHRSKLDPSAEWIDFLNTLAGQAAISIDRLQLFEDLQRSNVNLSQAYNQVIEGWARALELRDQETEGHSRRVERLTLNIARRMGIREKDLVHVRQGTLLHDIGKMGIPDSILLKPGKLTDEEWEMMKQHPTFAHKMLSPIDHLKPALEIPYCHHEKWDGSGYPQGLKGKEIPLAARIFAVVDVWDALRSDRPYRDAWSNEKALQYIKQESGKHFDPAVVEAFLDIVTDEDPE